MLAKRFRGLGRNEGGGVRKRVVQVESKAVAGVQYMCTSVVPCRVPKLR